LTGMAAGEGYIVVILWVERARDAVSTLVVRNWPLVCVDNLKLTAVLYVQTNRAREASEDAT
jgi:hypothetical protein